MLLLLHLRLFCHPGPRRRMKQIVYKPIRFSKPYRFRLRQIYLLPDVNRFQEIFIMGNYHNRAFIIPDCMG